jgi:hypothetical protein
MFCLLAIGSLNLATASNEKNVATKTTTTKNYTYKVTTTNVLVDNKIEVHCTLIVIWPGGRTTSHDLGNVGSVGDCIAAAQDKLAELSE